MKTVSLPRISGKIPGKSSVKLVSSSSPSSNLAVNSAYTGQSTASSLLASNSMLAAGASFQIQFDVLFSLSGRTDTIYNSATITAAAAQGAASTLSDISTNGTDPDSNGNGDPSDDSTPTPINAQVPTLQITKSASVPRALGGGLYAIDYTLTVKNTGSVDAPHVRVLDNLACTFNAGVSGSHFTDWIVTSGPSVANGLLNISSAFYSAFKNDPNTGGFTPCDTTAQSSTNPLVTPTFVSSSLTDGSRSLPAGSSETISFTVEATLDTAYQQTRNTVTNKAWVASYTDDSMTSGSLQTASASSITSVLIDPQGVVYDAVNRSPLSGAKIKVTRASCDAGLPTAITADQVINGTSSNYSYDSSDGSMTITTDSSGGYQFYLNTPPAPQDLCQYNLTVTPPTGYNFPSQLIPATSGVFASCGNVTSNAGAPTSSQSSTYYLKLKAGVKSNGSACEVMHNHIPLDPDSNYRGLILKKESTKAEAEFGDFVEYQLTLTNKVGVALSAPKIIDKLPPGFAYVSGTTRVNGVKVADPSGGAGPTLTFDMPSIALPADSSVVIRYRLRIGVGAPTTGDAINTAQGYANGYVSNQASWRLKIRGGAFSDDAFAFGRVYFGCLAKSDTGENLDSRQNFVGVPGVRMFLENGTNVTTDKDGKWSLYGLKPITHVLKVDPVTLPDGSQLIPLSNRNAGAGDSQFLDVKKGEFMRADFLIDACGENANGLLAEQINRRREAYTVVQSETYKTRLNYKDTTITTTDRGLAASGVLGSAGTQTGSAITSTTPLISLPGNSVVSGGGTTAPVVPNTSSATTATQSQPATGNAGALADTNGTNPAPVPMAASSNIPSVNSGQTDLLGPLAAQSIVDLEEALPQQDNTPGFMGIKDGDTLPSRVVNVRVKGPQGVTLPLFVNGVQLEERRVGKKATLESKQVTAWEYIGVELKPGQNELRLVITDEFGNARGEEKIEVIAPDDMARLVFELPKIARADPRKVIPIKLNITDAKGVPVTARTFVTVQNDFGGWLTKDLNPQEQGLQVAVEGGSTVLQFVPPGQPGEVRLQAITGNIKETVSMPLLPEQRPLVGVGIVEGVLDLSNRGAIQLGNTGSANAFENELKGMSSEGSNSRAAGRTAFFVKGTIKGEYLLTAAFDSDKTTSDRLFRDIRPEEYYPVYGDDSVRGFDAQSTQRFYVRIDKNRSYLLYGDFTTASSAEVRKLSQYSRSLTGAKHQYDNGNIRVTSFVSRTRSTQVVEELRALGISGPYYLTKISASDLLANSEKVEILVRDKNQPNIILSITAATRYTDYSIEALTGRIMFVSPVSSYDENMNPRSIRVTYEADQSGPEYTVLGTDAQFKVTNNLQVGVVAVKDDNPTNPLKIGAVTALGRIGATTMSAEAVATNSLDQGDGKGARFELKHETTNLRAIVQAFKTSATFDNPSGGVTAGRTEINARADYKIADDLRVRAEAIYTDSVGSTTDASKSVAVALQKRLNQNVVVEGAIRTGNSTGTSSSSFDYGQVTSSSGNLGSTTTSSGTVLNDATTTVRGRVTSRIPGLPAAQVFGEIEQDVNSEAHALAMGGAYAVTQSTRVYGRYEFMNSLASAYNLNASTQRNVGILGVENKYTEGGQLYNEYRLADTDSGRAATSAAGARQTFRINDYWRGTAGIEITRAISGESSSSSSTSSGISLGNSTAVVTGLSYVNGGFRSSSNLEFRNSSSTDSVTMVSGTGYRINDNWTLLSRSVYTRTQGSGTKLTQARQQIGLAYRPTDDDSWNALMRYERKYEDAGDSTSTSSTSTTSSSGITESNVFAGVVNWRPDLKTQVTGRYALKFSNYDADGIASNYWAQLIHSRYIRDLSPNWDVGVQAGVLNGKGGAIQTTLGIELGYQVMKNIWVSAGYNFVGLKDPDLTANEYTSKGPYMRVRMKFDENSFKNADGSELAQNSGGQVAVGDAEPPKDPSMPKATVAPVKSALGNARSNWAVGQPIPDYVEWREDLLFQTGSAELTAQGRQYVDELVKAITKIGTRELQISMGHDDPLLKANNQAQLTLWLKRVRTMKTLLANKMGPKRIEVYVDSSTYDIKKDPLAQPSSAAMEDWPLHIVVSTAMAGERPKVTAWRAQ